MHEAPAFAGEDVVMIGGANSAGQAALHFARYARQVTMLVRGGSLSASMSRYLVDQIAATSNICVRLGTRLERVWGQGHLERVEVLDVGGVREVLPVTGCFIFIGAQPRTEWLDGAVERDQHGFLLTGPELRRGRTWMEVREPLSLETSLPGVFAAGDVRSRSIKRVASAVGDGSIAVHLVHQYLGL
jgi:thioredoxin reductase (NADPH)